MTVSGMTAGTALMRRVRGAPLLCVLLCLGGLSQLAAPVIAQEADMATRLSAGLQCAFADPAERLAANMNASGAGPVELASALNALVDNPKTCGAIRAAAETELVKLNATAAVINQQELVLARQRMDAALREADDRAAQMRFVVEPPPRRLTRNSSTVP